MHVAAFGAVVAGVGVGYLPLAFAPESVVELGGLDLGEGLKGKGSGLEAQLSRVLGCRSSGSRLGCRGRQR